MELRETAALEKETELNAKADHVKELEAKVEEIPTLIAAATEEGIKKVKPMLINQMRLRSEHLRKMLNIRNSFWKIKMKDLQRIWLMREQKKWNYSRNLTMHMLR